MSRRRRPGSIKQITSYGTIKWQAKVGTKYLGQYPSEEEAEEAIQRYIADPENFEVPLLQRPSGSGMITESDSNLGKRYLAHVSVNGKKVALGTYSSKEEAEEAIERYKADPENFDFATRQTGTISKRGDNSFQLYYKGEYLGIYPTHEEAEEGFKRYLEDPENYEKPALRPRFNQIRDDNGTLTHRECTECERMLPMSEFALHVGHNTGHRSSCKGCQNSTDERREFRAVINRDEDGNIIQRHCTKCKELLPVEQFSLNQAICKECCHERYEDTKHIQLEKQKERYLENREEFLERKKKRKEKRMQDPSYREEYLRKKKEYHQRVTKHRLRERRQNDEGFRILDNLRRRLNQAVNGVGEKSDNTIKLIGLSSGQDIIDYLRLKSPEYDDIELGKNDDGLVIDHYIPCEVFDMTNTEHQRICFHYTNLQLLRNSENSEKSDKIPPGFDLGTHIEKQRLQLERIKRENLSYTEVLVLQEMGEFVYTKGGQDWPRKGYHGSTSKRV
mgnify:CR=1 FL=1|jgi:hypothetical protein|tara:strand:+ start:62 stop:1573 length:1512 start_codon:yes stop_codon:yes gene_type:complete